MRRLETRDFWPKLLAEKDALSLRELAEKYKVTAGAISTAFKREGISRTAAPPGPRKYRELHRAEAAEVAAKSPAPAKTPGPVPTPKKSATTSAALLAPTPAPPVEQKESAPISAEAPVPEPVAETAPAPEPLRPAPSAEPVTLTAPRPATTRLFGWRVSFERLSECSERLVVAEDAGQAVELAVRGGRGEVVGVVRVGEMLQQ